MVRRRVCQPIVGLTATMSRLAGGDVTGEISGIGRDDEIGAMAAAVRVFKDNMIKADRLAAEKEAENDIKMRRARVLDDLTRAFETKVGYLKFKFNVTVEVTRARSLPRWQSVAVGHIPRHWMP